MEGYELLRILWAVFLGTFLIIAGLLTSKAKDEPGIGFRIGYTYLSERVRRRANRISGIGTIITGPLMALSPSPDKLAGDTPARLLGTTILLAYLAAKHGYELEELSKEVPGKRGEL